MADIIINVDAVIVSPMNYEGYSIGQSTTCGGDGSQRNVRFDDTLGDFVVGRNFTNSAGFPAQTLTILNFTDESVFIENSTGNETPAPGASPSRLKNLTTNVVISTFPTDVPIANLSQLGLEINSVELLCPSDMINNTARRTRKLTYQIKDSNGNIGPVKIAIYNNIPM
jgi:hypothetical protein